MNALNKLRKARKSNRKKFNQAKEEIEERSLSLIRSDTEKITLRKSSSINDSRRKAAEQTLKDYKDGLIDSYDEETIRQTHIQMKNGTYNRHNVETKTDDVIDMIEKGELY